MTGRVTDTDVLNWIRLYWDRHGYAPSIREIALGVGLTSTSAAQHHVNRLDRDGLIARTEGIARSIRILAEAS